MTAPARTPHASPGPEPTALRMPPTVRKAATVLHVICSVGWLGTTLSLLTLGVTALLTNDADTLRTSYRAMKILGDDLIIPVSLLALLTGLLLSFGTKWRLLTYKWVLTKFVLTLAAAGLSIFELRARLNEAATLVAHHPTGPISAMPFGTLRSTLVIAPTVAMCVYVANVTLSIFKPWGKRRRAVK